MHLGRHAKDLVWDACMLRISSYGVSEHVRQRCQIPSGWHAELEHSVRSSASEPSDPVGTSRRSDAPRKGKRATEIDLGTIEDPSERRKQRRLAKNRATAALSRYSCNMQMTCQSLGSR